MEKVRNILIALILALPFAVFASDQETELQKLVERAVLNNPQIRSAEEEFNSSRYQISQETLLEDPNLFANFQNIPTDSFSFSDFDMTMKEFGLMQNLPISGDRFTQRKIAKIKSSEAQKSFEDKKAYVEWMIKDRYYELAYIEGEISLLKKNIKISNSLVEISTAKLESMADGEKFELFQVKTDLVKYQKEMNDLLQEKKDITAEIMSIVNDREKIYEPDPYKFRDVKFDISKEDAIKHVNNNHPFVREKMEMVEASKKSITLSKQKWIPNVGAMVAYQQRDAIPGNAGSGRESMSVGVQVSIPLFSIPGQIGRVREAKAMSARSRAELEGAKRKMEYEIEVVYAEYERVNANISLIQKTLIPVAQATYDVSKASYEAGRAEYHNVLTSQFDVYEYEKEFLRNKIDKLKVVAKLDYLLTGIK